MIAVHLTTYLPASFTHDGTRIRRRRLLGRGQRVRFELREGYCGDPEASTQTVLLDGEPIAYAAGEQWNSVDGDWWGTGLDIRVAS